MATLPVPLSVWHMWIVALHNEGWAHFRESQEQLASSFRALGLADRLQRLERGKPVVVPLKVSML